MQDLFDLLASSMNPYGQKLKTNFGDKSEMQIIDQLTYISYATQRDQGMTHKQCIKIGLGNDSFQALYDQEQPNNSLHP